MTAFEREGYDHKATSESFNQADKVTILYSRVDGDYIVVINDDTVLNVTKTQLELIAHAAGDVLHDQAV